MTDSQLPKDDPRGVAFAKYKETYDYANIKRWAANPAHTEVSLWAAFVAGMDAQPRQPDNAALVEALEAIKNARTVMDGGSINECRQIASKALSKHVAATKEAP